MFSLYNLISNSVFGKNAEFHCFSKLPAELRLKIWRLALPERVVEASLRFEDRAWACSYSEPKNPTKDRRTLPTLFKVNIESYELCLQEYVRFGNTYIHPTLDFLYISWYWGQDMAEGPTKFYPIQGQPLASFNTVAMTIGRSPSFDSRFGALVNCLQTLGVPRELMLSLVGPKLPSVHSVSSGFSISNGNKVSILNWPNKVNSNMAQEVRAHVIAALKAEQTDESFKLPTSATSSITSTQDHDAMISSSIHHLLSS